MKILVERKLVEPEPEYFRRFTYKSTLPELKGSSFHFPCNSDGKIDQEKLHPNAQKNLKECLKGKTTVKIGQKIESVQDPNTGEYGYLLVPDSGTEIEIEILDHGLGEFIPKPYWDPAIGECPCGEEVELYGFTNTCDSCHRDFNMSGQELAPREQWGSCTGEQLSDILGPSRDDDDF